MSRNPPSAKNRRSESPSVRFVNGYAEGWFFAVHEAFRPALDILFSTLIDPEPTRLLREKRLRERGYLSREDLDRRVSDPRQRREIMKEINRYKRYRQVWTEGNPPAYDFHEGDTLSSGNQRYVLQVDTVARDGLLKVRVLERSPDQGLRHTRDIFCDQADFVGLLRSGLAALSSLDLP